MIKSVCQYLVQRHTLKVRKNQKSLCLSFKPSTVDVELQKSKKKKKVLNPCHQPAVEPAVAAASKYRRYNGAYQRAVAVVVDSKI